MYEFHMIAERSESVRRRIAEALASEPSITRADIDRLERGMSARAVRAAARMARLRDALRSDRLRPDPARLERIRRRTDRAADVAALLERVVRASYSADRARARLERTENHLANLADCGIPWPAACRRRLARAFDEIAVAYADIRLADPAGRYRTRGSELDRAAAAAGVACSKARRVVADMADIVADLDGWPAGPEPEWYGPALAELATEPDTVLGWEAGR